MCDSLYKDLPIIVGFPRSGNHFITALLESYFNKRRFNNAEFCFCSEIKNDCLFYGTHDLESIEKFNHDNILYLYRSPVTLLFSYYKAETRYRFGTQRFIDSNIRKLILHYNKYLFSGLSKRVVRYEYLQTNFLYEFEKIIRFFNENLNIQKAIEINKILTKNFTINYIVKSSSSKVGNRYINKNMLSSKYEKERNNFAWLYGSYIFDELIKEFGRDKLSTFFKEV